MTQPFANTPGVTYPVPPRIRKIVSRKATRTELDRLWQLFQEGHKQREIAKMMDRSDAWVSTWLSRAREWVRKKQ